MQSLGATNKSMPFYLLGSTNNGENVSSSPGRAAIIYLETPEQGVKRTPFNYLGPGKLLTFDGVRNFGDEFYRLAEEMDNEESCGRFGVQTAPIIEGGLPLIICQVTSTNKPVTNNKARENLGVMTIGENPARPKREFLFSYVGPRRILTYEEALRTEFPFLDEVRELTEKLNSQVSEEYIRTKLKQMPSRKALRRAA